MSCTSPPAISETNSQHLPPTPHCACIGIHVGTWEKENFNQHDVETEFVKKVVNMLPENAGDCIQSPKILLCFSAHNDMRSKTDYGETKDLSKTVSYVKEWPKLHI